MKLNPFIVNDNPMEKLLYCFGGDGDSGGGGGGSAGDFDDSYNDAMGYDSGFDDGDTGDTGGNDGYDFYADPEGSPTYPDVSDTGSSDRPATNASEDPSEYSTVDFGYDYSTPTTDTGSFLDSDNDGIPDTIDVDTRQPTTVDYGYDYPSAPAPTDYGYDYATPTTTTGTYGAETSFSNIYDPFSGGDYGVSSPTGDSDEDGIPDYLDSDTTRPFSPYESWQAMPDYTFQKQLIQNPQDALKRFGAKSKKIDTLKNGQEVYTVTVGQKNPITGEVLDRSYVYTTGPDGETVKDLYNVTDENALSDAIGNALGFAVPLAVGIPVRASGDTKVMNKYTQTSQLYKEADVSKQYYSTSALTSVGKELSRTTTIETEAERTARLAREVAEQARDQGGDGGASSIIIPRREDEETEPTKPGGYEEYFEKFMGSTPRYQSPYDVMRGRTPTQTAAVGGQIAQPDDYLSVNADYVKQMPDAFMRDPAMAKSAEEVKAIFAHNRRVQEIAGGKQTMNAGGQAVSAENVAVVGESGAIGANPEQVTEAQSVADDIEKTVPEGTFIINQPAAELMGTADVKDMLLNAVKELRKQGVDFSFGEGKIPEEDAVSLLVSKGEIMVHPLLAKVIGIGRLNKINNRGKAEVEKRIAENGQSPEAEQAQAVAAYGGAQAQGSQGDSPDSFINVRGEYGDEDFSVRPSASYSESSSSINYPDGAVVDDTGKNIGFALDGEMFLKDDRSLRAGIQRQAGQSKRKIKIPEEFGGDTIEFKSGHKMKRYNMGATFGDLSADVSKQQGSNQPISGRVQYKFSPSGEVFIEGTEGGRSGRVGLNYRF